MKYATIFFVFVIGCYNSSGSTPDTDSNEDDSTTAFNGDTDSDTDADSDTGTDSNRDTDTTSDSDTQTLTDSDTSTDPLVEACLENAGYACSCYGNCEDGTGYIMYYSEDEVPTDIGYWYPSVEEMEAGLFWYSCSQCEPCHNSFAVKLDDGSWTTTTKTAFCEALVAYNNACGNCLVTGL